MQDTIKALGGAAYVAQRLGYEQNRVANWYKRGIPLTDRPAIAALAAESGVQLPDDFLPVWMQPDPSSLKPEADDSRPSAPEPPAADSPPEAA